MCDHELAELLGFTNDGSLYRGSTINGAIKSHLYEKYGLVFAMSVAGWISYPLVSLFIASQRRLFDLVVSISIASRRRLLASMGTITANGM